MDATGQTGRIRGNPSSLTSWDPLKDRESPESVLVPREQKIGDSLQWEKGRGSFREECRSIRQSPYSNLKGR